MSDQDPIKSDSIVRLNEIVDLIAGLSSGKISLGQNKLKDCDIRCGCNTRDCGCHGGVSKVDSIIDQISLPEMKRMREQRIQDLKNQLAKVEAFKLG